MDKKLIRSKYDYINKMNELKSKINTLKKAINIYEETITKEEDKTELENMKNDLKTKIQEISIIEDNIEILETKIAKNCKHEVVFKNMYHKDDYYCPICGNLTNKRNILLKSKFLSTNILSYTELLIDAECHYSSDIINNIYKIIAENIKTEKDIIEEISLYVEEIQYDNDIKVYVRR